MFLATEQHWAKLFSDDVLGKAKSFFPHTQEGKIYLNNAATAPMSSRVVDAMSSHLKERSVGRIETYERDMVKIEECRKSVQALVNAESPDRIALTANTSEGINIIAAGLRWKPGERILLHESEFPANVWPYLNARKHGVELDVIPAKLGHPTPQLIADMITPATRLVALSAVQFLTGYRADLAAIGDLCRSKGILFVVDGIQAAGAVAIDVKRMKIDGFATGCQKWQLAPQGTGWLYLTEELQEQIDPAHVGWLAVEDPWQFYNYEQPLASAARRYEAGTKNIAGLWGMQAALSILLEFSVEKIESHILALTQMLMNGLHTVDGLKILTPNGQMQRAGIVTIQLPESIDSKAVFKKLMMQDITLSLREGKLRFSPHFYNSATEIALAVAALRDAVGGK